MEKKLFFVLVKTTTLKSSLQSLRSGRFDLILLISESKQSSLSDMQRSVFTEIVPVSDFSFSGLLKEIEPILAKRDFPSELGFTTNDESSLVLAGLLRDHFNTGEPSFSSVNRFKDKRVMKEALIKGDPSLEVPRFIAVDAREYALSPAAYICKIENTLSYPIFAKPVDSAASCFTRTLKDRGDLERWLNENGMKENFELDEFLIGDLYHCDSLVKDGEIKFSKASRYHAPCAAFMSGVPLASMPVLEDSAEAREILAYNRKVLQALAPVPNGAFHLEVFRLPKGRLVFLEIACRTPGAYAPQVFQKAFGIHLEEAHLAFQMGIDTAETCQVTAHGHGAFLWYPMKEGIVKQLRRPEISSQCEVDWKIKVGDRLSGATELGDFAVGIKIWGEDYAEIKRQFESLSHFEPFTLET